MLLCEVLNALSFSTESRGYYRGQQDLSLVAKNETGQIIGRIDYSLWNDEIAVQMISVNDDQRGKGYGIELIKQLQREYPDIEIDFGMQTTDGAKMIRKLPMITIPNQEYSDKAKRLATLKELDAKWRDLADAFDANPTEEERLKLLPIFARWNDLHDEVTALEDDLRGMKPSKRLVQI